MKEPARSRILHLLIAAGHSSHDINLLMQELELDIQQEYLNKVQMHFIKANESKPIFTGGINMEDYAAKVLCFGVTEPNEVERNADHGC